MISWMRPRHLNSSIKFSILYIKGIAKIKNLTPGALIFGF